MKKRRYITLAMLLIIAIVFFIFFNLNYSITGKVTYENQPGPAEGIDSFARDDFPNFNFGSNTRLGVGKTAGGAELRAFLYFDVSGIPSNQTVLDGKITLYLEESSGVNPIIIDVYKITSNWTESGVSWNNRYSGAPWDNPGGDYEYERVGYFIANQEDTFYNISIRETIQEWIHNPSENYGIILIANDSVSNGQYRYFASSEYEIELSRPKIIIEHTDNAAPIMTNFSQDSSINNPTTVGENITFNAEWYDLENDEARLFVCSSEGINISGCQEETLCSSDLSRENPSSCSYTVRETDIRINMFSIGVCDNDGCSEINQSYYYGNRPADVEIIQPNGGEIINQSRDGNYTVIFEISDRDNDPLTASLYYNRGSPGTSNTIIENINLSSFCSGGETINGLSCQYSWNTTGIYGENFYITVIGNDTFSKGNGSSSAGFSIYSVDDPFPPEINQIWFEEPYSGKTMEIFANITDENLDQVWLTINTTTQENTSLVNIYGDIFLGNWSALEVGSYELIIYARDVVGNQNNSETIIFNVLKPEASAQSPNHPEKTLPYHTIKISGKINASNPLKEVYTNLNYPNEFSLVQGYPRETEIGNISENQTDSAEWLLSAPLEEGKYNFNITFTDKFSNQWQSPSGEIEVTSAIGDYDLDLVSYNHVVGGRDYYAETLFKKGVQYINSDSMRISIYDAVGNLIIDSISMNNIETGKYNYTYRVPSTSVEGHWQTIINATKDSENYYKTAFWRVLGGPFDVRNIQIIDSSIPILGINVDAENTGDLNKDFYLEWNLTREDNEETLHSGAETFMVEANSNKTWTVYPETNYIGEVKITFIGQDVISGEKAGAYRVFTTTEQGNDPSDPETPSTGGGGGVTKDEKEIIDRNLIPNFEFIDYEKIIFLTTNLNKKIILEILNSGNKTLTDINLNLEGIDSSFYNIYPKTMNSLNPNQTGIFEIIFEIQDFSGEIDFFYNITEKEITKKVPGKINVVSMQEYFIKEIQRLRSWIRELRIKANDENKKELDMCDLLLDRAENNVLKKEYISANEQLQEAETCIRDVEEKIKTQKDEFKFPYKIKESIFWIITWLLIIIIMIILITIVYMLSNKFDIIDYFNKKNKTKNKEEIKQDLFYKKLKEIHEKID